MGSHYVGFWMVPPIVHDYLPFSFEGGYTGVQAFFVDHFGRFMVSGKGGSTFWGDKMFPESPFDIVGLTNIEVLWPTLEYIDPIAAHKTPVVSISGGAKVFGAPRSPRNLVPSPSSRFYIILHPEFGVASDVAVNVPWI